MFFFTHLSFVKKPSCEAKIGRENTCLPCVTSWGSRKLLNYLSQLAILCHFIKNSQLDIVALL